MRIVLQVLATILSLAYPFLVYYLLQKGLTLAVAVLLPVVLLLRLIAGGFKKIIEGIGLFLIGLVMVGLYFLDNQNEAFLLLYPVLINLAFLTVFASSLTHKSTPIVEKIATLHVKLELQNSDFKSYCRQVTVAWCLFFIGNGALALATVICGNREIWTLYNGCIAYILIGLMFAGEYLVRRFLKRVG